MRQWLQSRIRHWARRRQGLDPDPVVLGTRRIYILPTRMGVAYGLMLFAMLLGAMNYANNLALGLAFLLGALALVAMHHCHRNLAGLQLGGGVTQAVFAGQNARFGIALVNPARVPRYDISLANDHSASPTLSLDPDERRVLEIELPTERRGRLSLERFEVSTSYPFGLFRAWAILHMDLHCLVYPRPSTSGIAPPPMETDVGSAQHARRGDDDFAGLRRFQPGDSTRHIAWRAYARGQELQVKQYAGTTVTSYLLDWDALEGLDVEQRLSRLCRWIEDAYAAGRAFGLKIPGTTFEPNVGSAHRQRCLSALALFEG